MLVIACSRGDGCQTQRMPCFTCLGTGQQSVEESHRQDASDRLYAYRRGVGISALNAAGRLHMAPRRYNDLELGKVGTTVAEIDRVLARLVEICGAASSGA